MTAGARAWGSRIEGYVEVEDDRLKDCDCVKD